MQYPLGIPPPLRSNIDYVFIFNDTSVKNRKKIYEDYAGMIPSFNEFCRILEQCCEDHGCLVIHTSGNSAKLEDQIYFYRAELRNNFRVGDDKIWDFFEKRYNKGNEEQNINTLKEKTKLKIILNKNGETIREIKY